MSSLRELWLQRWPSFQPEEVLGLTGMELFKQGYLPMQVSLMDRLQSFRKVIGKEFLINYGDRQCRGCRSIEENSSCGGAEHSWHCKGLACDVTVPGMSCIELYKLALEYGFMGVGLYENFVHMDMRIDKFATWDFRGR